MDIAEREIEEIWKSPPSLDMPWVEVSNLGRIRTLDHKCLFSRMGKKQMRQRKGRIRKLFTKKRPRKMPDLQSGIGIDRPAVID
jgi:hypothetical protein